MGIIHHANYIRWFESARIYFMTELGFPYKALEASGIISPVLGITCDYKAMSYFDESLEVYIKVKKFNGVKLELIYEVVAEDGEVRATGSSSHCFLDQNGKIVNFKKAEPKYYEALRSYQEGDVADYE